MGERKILDIVYDLLEALCEALGQMALDIGDMFPPLKRFIEAFLSGTRQQENQPQEIPL